MSRVLGLTDQEVARIEALYADVTASLPVHEPDGPSPPSGFPPPPVRAPRTRESGVAVRIFRLPPTVPHPRKADSHIEMRNWSFGGVHGAVQHG